MASTMTSFALILLPFLSIVAAQTPENGGVTPATPDTIPTPSPTGPGDVVAGASGGGNGINISKGGLIAIILVVALVATLGIVSAVLFYLAKKRQWELRKSIRRTARRFTGRQPGGQSQASASKSTPKTSATKPKKPEAKVAMNDLEKGSPQTKSSFESEPPVSTPWHQRLLGQKPRA